MKTLKLTSNFLLVIFLLTLFSISHANENNLNDYFKTIRCLVCDGQSIQESDTEFAINLKEQIKIKNDSGMSLKEINQELVEIYGEQVSFNPSKNHFLLWLMPLILLLIIFIFIRNKLIFFYKK
ncbi:cytochrome c-type biogenesis protein CcmH [Alphaproteobacteria bacterium]|nr:cytochrome c-type biogenesis protein CcmH [Alphaproteobacteria bacterium]